MKLNLTRYKSIIFDCDGVLLNSNPLKTQAFYNTALPFDISAAKQLVKYHVSHGGISRYQKFQLFLDVMIPSSVTKPSLDYLLYTFSSEVRNGLINCELTAGLDKLKALTPEARWLITSGGDQQELRDVFALRGLDTLFNGGIYGSPDTKEEILSRELSGNSPWRPGLYIGDSMYDHLAASNADLDFIFASKWTEFQEWQDYCHKHSIISIESLSELL